MLSGEPQNSTVAGKLGRSSLIVFCITVVLIGALTSVLMYAPLDLYDTGVIEILIATLSVVGTLWALLLLVRGGWHGERVGVTFTVLLTILWLGSLVMLPFWRHPARSTLISGKFVVFACLPVFIPALAFALTIGGTVGAVVRRCVLRVSKTNGSSPGMRGWRWVFAGAAFIFALFTPFLFYAYGGTSAGYSPQEHWTFRAIRKMPRWMGDVVYGVMKTLPDTALGRIETSLITSNLLSASFYQAQLDESIKTKEQYSWNLEMLAQADLPAALEWIREKLQHNPEHLDNSAAGYLFSIHATDAELRALLKAETLKKYPWAFRSSLLNTLSQRSDLFTNECAALFEADRKEFSEAVDYMMYGAHDGMSEQFYLKLAEQRDVHFERGTLYLTTAPRGKILAKGILHADLQVRERVLEILFHNTSDQPDACAKMRSDKDVRAALTEVFEQGTKVHRVLAALVIHKFSDAVTPELKQRYGMQFSTRPQIEASHVRGTSEIENAATIDSARALLKKW